MNELFHRNKVLYCHLGQMHDDGQVVAEKLREQGIEYIPFNLLTEDIQETDFSDVAYVDLRSVRKWTNNWKNFQSIISVLSKKCDEENVKISHNPKSFEWCYDKSLYLNDLQSKNVNVVKTDIVRVGDKFSLSEYVKNKHPSELVIKPSRSAKARGLQFIKYNIQTQLFETQTPQEDGKNVKIIQQNSEQLDQSFAKYRSHLFEGRREDVLVQEFMLGIEKAAVKLGDHIFFVRKLPGKETRVAHEHFGGINKPMDNVSFKLRVSAKKIFDSLPDFIQSNNICRIDLIENENEVRLLEAETGSARLFLLESGKIDLYVNLIKQHVKNANLEKDYIKQAQIQSAL